MATRNPQTMAKRAREQAVRERRDRKREKRSEAAAARRAAADQTTDETAPLGEPQPQVQAAAPADAQTAGK